MLYANTALNFLLRMRMESKQSGFTIQIKRIAQKSNLPAFVKYDNAR